MNAITLTTILGLVITAGGTIGFPLYMNKQKTRQEVVTRQTVDSQSVAGMFKDERDRLQLRLDTMQGAYERRIDDMRRDNEAALAATEAKWKTLHEQDQTQIAELRVELQGLYRQLYQQRPPASP